MTRLVGKCLVIHIVYECICTVHVPNTWMISSVQSSWAWCNVALKIQFSVSTCTYSKQTSQLKAFTSLQILAHELSSCVCGNSFLFPMCRPLAMLFMFPSCIASSQPKLVHCVRLMATHMPLNAYIHICMLTTYPLLQFVSATFAYMFGLFEGSPSSVSFWSISLWQHFQWNSILFRRKARYVSKRWM